MVNIKHGIGVLGLLVLSGVLLVGSGVADELTSDDITIDWEEQPELGEFYGSVADEDIEDAETSKSIDLSDVGETSEIGMGESIEFKNTDGQDMEVLFTQSILGVDERLYIESGEREEVRFRGTTDFYVVLDGNIIEEGTVETLEERDYEFVEEGIVAYYSFDGENPDHADFGGFVASGDVSLEEGIASDQSINPQHSVYFLENINGGAEEGFNIGGSYDESEFTVNFWAEFEEYDFSTEFRTDNAGFEFRDDGEVRDLTNHNTYNLDEPIETGEEYFFTYMIQPNMVVATFYGDQMGEIITDSLGIEEDLDLVVSTENLEEDEEDTAFFETETFEPSQVEIRTASTVEGDNKVQLLDTGNNSEVVEEKEFPEGDSFTTFELNVTEEDFEDDMKVRVESVQGEDKDGNITESTVDINRLEVASELEQNGHEIRLLANGEEIMSGVEHESLSETDHLRVRDGWSKIDHLSLYDRVLDQEEIEHNMEVTTEQHNTLFSLFS